MSSKLTFSTARLAYTTTLLAAVLALGGCMARSIAPAVGAKDRVVDRRLVGTWRGDDNERARIELRDSSYAVLYTDKDGKGGPFVGQLGRLGNRWILDLTPDDSGVPGTDAYKGLLLPLHTFLVFDSIGDRIDVSGLKEDSIKAYLEREPTAVAHMRVDDDLVLTAPTAELRIFLQRFVARPGVLESTVWTRR